MRCLCADSFSGQKILTLLPSAWHLRLHTCFLLWTTKTLTVANLANLACSILLYETDPCTWKLVRSLTRSCAESWRLQIEQLRQHDDPRRGHPEYSAGRVCIRESPVAFVCCQTTLLCVLHHEISSSFPPPYRWPKVLSSGLCLIIVSFVLDTNHKPPKVISSAMYLSTSMTFGVRQCSLTVWHVQKDLATRSRFLVVP